MQMNNQSSDERFTLIIGAGMTGLTAAYTLCQRWREMYTWNEKIPLEEIAVPIYWMT